MAVNYTLSPQVTYRSEYFGALVFHRASWGIYTVNETGFAILKLLSKRNVSREHMHQLLGSVYAHLKDAQMYEIDIFFDRLLALGVIVEKPETDDGSVLNLDPIAGLTEPSISRTIPRHLSSPTFVWWDITSTCNLRCRHCYSNSGASLHDELTTEEVKHILDQLAIMNVFYVYILGGEPLLRKDFMDILGYCRSLNIEVMVSSNGWFITADLACTLARLGIRHVRVSIDGATAKTHDAIRGVNGSFDRAVAAVRNLKRAGVPVVGISPTLMKENVHEAEMLIELAHDLQVDELQFVQVCAVGRAKQISVLDSWAPLMLKDLIAQVCRTWRRPLDHWFGRDMGEALCSMCHGRKNGSPYYGMRGRQDLSCDISKWTCKSVLAISIRDWRPARSRPSRDMAGGGSSQDSMVEKY